jgi:hypothetical protein
MSKIGIVAQTVYFVKAGDETLDPSRPDDLEKIVTFLATPGAALNLARDGHAGAVIELLRAMPPEGQAAVLAAPDAVWGLSDNGQAAAVIELLRAMKPEGQTAVLAAPHAVFGLAENGQGAAVKAIQRSLTPKVPGGGRPRASLPVNSR